MTAKDLACEIHDALCRQNHTDECQFFSVGWKDSPKREYLAAAALLMRRMGDVDWRRVRSDTGHC
jgi:hypothetical protein